MEPEVIAFLLGEAIKEAELGYSQGGIPIGSVLAIEGEIVGRGHNQRIQQGSPTLHAEMDCLEKAGRLSARDYQRAVIVSTLSPCDMCSGAILLYKIPQLIVGENQSFQGPEEYVKQRGVNTLLVQDKRCMELMDQFMKTHPELWNEDIGE